VFDQSTLLWGLLFGSFGLGYFVYGRKERAVVPLACGIGLMVVPYIPFFIAHTVLMAIVGGVLMVIPYFLRF
jgi:hypothetical protein